jgi:predicted  nucleic acid-binding Zn-ribbon protein
MPGPAAIVKESHRLRRHIKDLDAKIEQAPRQLQIQQAKLARQEDVLKQAHANLKQIALEIRDKEGSIKATEQQISRYEKQLNEAANKKEYDALKSEIAQEKEHVSKLEDEVLAAITLTEEKSAQLPEVEKTTQQARADFAQFENDFKERLERFAREKERARSELQTVEATLPDDVRVTYDRLIAAKGTDALAGVTGRTCSECYVEITAQMASELKRELFLLCKNCGRILYVEK